MSKIFSRSNDNETGLVKSGNENSKNKKYPNSSLFASLRKRSFPSPHFFFHPIGLAHFSVSLQGLAQFVAEIFPGHISYERSLKTGYVRQFCICSMGGLETCNNVFGLIFLFGVISLVLHITYDSFWSLTSM